MKKLLLTLILICSFININAQKNSSKNSRVEQFFYRDSIVALEMFFNKKKKVDSIKSYHKTGEPNEVFYVYKNKFHGEAYKFNKFGEKLTTWNFNNGELISRIDHKIEFNKKSERKTKKAHAKLKEVNEVLKHDPKNLEAKYNRARARVYLGNHVLALRDFIGFEKLITNLPEDKKVPEKIAGAIYDYIAYIYSGYEMKTRTIHYGLKAIEASPKESRLYYNLGDYLIKIKAYRLGITFLNRAIDMTNSHSFANWGLSKAYSDLGDYKKAMTHVNIAFKNEDNLYKRGSGDENADERDLRTTRGFLYHKLGESEKGITDLEEALSINENNSFAYRNLGEIYYDLEDYNKACNCFKKAKTLGYEKLHDRDNLEVYLDYSCKQTTTNTQNKIAKTIAFSNKPFIFPNPTKGLINIRNLDFENYDFIIFDYTGKVVKRGSSKTPINISNLPNGVYVLKVSHQDLNEIFRVIKD